MKQRVVAEIRRRIEKDSSKGLFGSYGVIPLYMKKYVFEEDDEEHTFVGDCLRLSYPCEFFGKTKYTLLTEFSHEKFVFDSIDDVADFIIKTYC